MKRCPCGNETDKLPCKTCASKRARLQHIKRPIMACPCCGVVTKMQLDHKVALAVGGTHDVTNLQWLCAPCNRSKGSGQRCMLEH